MLQKYIVSTLAITLVLENLSNTIFQGVILFYHQNLELERVCVSWQAA